ncbi:MAG TPA: aconitase family protein, partial [Candidatus Acidoferrales bacterium]|nr:aconitase family protein [Candidatus Acidoferrales bacterium]
MPGETISEKILSAKSGRDARAGDVVICRVDCAMGTDGAVPMALDYFAAMGGKRVFAPEQVVFALDHYAGDGPTAELHRRVRDFAAAHGIRVWEVGEGIGHQLILEQGLAKPGDLVLGADSHAVTYGAVNAFATGIGSSDLAAILVSGEIWLRVPESIRVTLTGKIPPGVGAKDAALVLARELGADGATYQALEFAGVELPLDDRIVLANMSVEMGAKNGIFPAGVKPDPDARYVREIHVALNSLTPQVALPHHVDNVAPVGEAAGTPIQMVYLGTCTGGRVSDYHEALRVLQAGGGPAAGVELVVVPASRAVLDTLTADGTIAAFEGMGAKVGAPGCG